MLRSSFGDPKSAGITVKKKTKVKIQRNFYHYWTSTFSRWILQFFLVIRSALHKMSGQADHGFFLRTRKNWGKHFYFSLLLSANVRTISGQHSDICPPNVLMMSSPCPHKLLLQNLLPHHQHHECIKRPLIIFNHNWLKILIFFNY